MRNGRVQASLRRRLLRRRPRRRPDGQEAAVRGPLGGRTHHRGRHDTRTWLVRGTSQAVPVTGSRGAQRVSLSADGTILLEQNELGSRTGATRLGRSPGRHVPVRTDRRAGTGRPTLGLGHHLRRDHGVRRFFPSRSVKLTRSGTPTAYLLFSQDGSLLLTAGPSAQPRVWQVSDGRPGGLLAGGRGAAATTPTLASGDRAAVGYSDGTVRVWALPAAPVTAEVGSAPPRRARRWLQLRPRYGDGVHHRRPAAALDDCRGGGVHRRLRANRKPLPPRAGGRQRRGRPPVAGVRGRRADPRRHPASPCSARMTA